MLSFDTRETDLFRLTLHISGATSGIGRTIRTVLRGPRWMWLLGGAAGTAAHYDLNAARIPFIASVDFVRASIILLCASLTPSAHVLQPLPLAHAAPII